MAKRFETQAAFEGPNGETKTVTVFGRDENTISSLAEHAAEHLGNASTRISHTLLKLNTWKTTACVHYYARDLFGIVLGELQEQDIQTIRCKLNMIKTGLSADVTIKAFIKAKEEAQTNYKKRTGLQFELNEIGGLVSWKKTEPDENKPWKTTVSRHHLQQTSGNIHGMRISKWTVGAIMLSEKVLGDERLGAITLIHEASHKYAGTCDHCYVKPGDRMIPDEFRDKSYTLINADSYAYFVYFVGDDTSDYDFYPVPEKIGRRQNRQEPAKSRPPPQKRGCILQ